MPRSVFSRPLAVFLTPGAILMSLLTALRVVTASPAPQHDSNLETHGAGVERRLEGLTKNMNLDGEQRAKIRRLLEDVTQQILSHREDSLLSSQERR
jgi:Spy/CpxP family protein refolding chaperone